MRLQPWQWLGLGLVGLWALTRVAQASPVGTGPQAGQVPTLPVDPSSTTPPVVPSAPGPGYTPTGAILSGSGLPIPAMDEHPKRDPYIDQLWAREQTWKPIAREFYNVDRERRIARAAAAFYGVPPSWVWGLVRGESNFYPVGIFSASPSKAKARKSNAYGMGQILRGRFDKSEKAWIHASSNNNGWNHSDMIDPKRGIWSVAASLGRGAKNRGGGPGKSLAKQQAAIKKMALEQDGLLVGKWWAGFSDAYEGGARKKIGQILTYGPDVYDTGPPPWGFLWQKSGQTLPADDLPPWMIGSLDSAGVANLQAAAINLEAAGSWLADPG
jgi:hypothetical protein